MRLPRPVVGTSSRVSSLSRPFFGTCAQPALVAASAEEEVGWDEDSDDESPPPAPKTASKVDGPGSVESSTTIHPPKDKLLKPSESRKSDEKSQPDSEASYDVVGLASGVPSQAPNSPKDIRKGDDSDEEDWE